MEKLFRWIAGELYIELKGDSEERFINLCRNNGITVREICRKNETCYLKMSLRDYYKIRAIARKTKVFPVVRQRRGLPFFMKYLQKRKTFCAGIILFLLFLYILAGRIWCITISGQQRYSSEQLEKYLRSISIMPGMKREDIDCHQLEEKIRQQYNDIGWVSAELKGSYLQIQILENKVIETGKKKEEKVHIIAAHAGTVESIVTRQGTPMVHKGDVVKKGDILISGVVNVVGDNETLIEKKAVQADGDVNLVCQYVYEKELEREYIERKVTGKDFTVWRFDVAGYSFYFYNPLKQFESFAKYDIINCGNYVKLENNYQLPVYINRKTYQEVKEEQKKYTEEQLMNQLKSDYRRYKISLEEKGITLLEEDKISSRITDTSLRAKTVLRVSEPQTKTIKVKKNEWRMEAEDEFDRGQDEYSHGT